ncbi:hypothetical protein BDW22DRAFT_883384 [Trametopsis cervina]|nr:hypothetical protein BDW22DRAFT_883384 [Trametopsis cervina]
MVVALDEHLRADPARIELQLKELHADITNGWEVSRLQIYTILPDQLTHLSCETESIPVSKFAYWGTELIKSRTILTRPSALLSVSLHGRDPSSRFGIFKQSQMDSLPFSLAQVIEGLDGDKKSKITLHHSETSKTIGTIVLKFDDFVYPKPTNMKDLPTDYSALPDACSINLAKALKSWMYFYPPIKPHAPPFVHVFTWSTLSSLWRYHHTPRSDDNRVVLIREGSSDPRNAGKPENLVLYDNCAEDILIQLKDLLVSIVLSPNFRTFSQDPLFVDVMLAVWRSVAYVEGVKEYHSQLTYIYARLWATADVARMQRNLFFLRFKTALLLQGQPVYTGEFDRHAIVGMLFELSRPELRSHQEEPFSRKQLQWRPFTAVLASPRGIEANYVWEVMEQLLKQCSQSSMRDEYRRAMTRLVQTADFVPNNIHIGYIAKHAELSSGGFGAVYSGENASGSAVAIKAPHTLSQFEYNLIVRNVNFS